MFNRKIIKKVSIAVASLALILPLVSVNGASIASAKGRKAHVVRVIKSHKHTKPAAKMDDHGNVRGHHYYRYAFNRREYRKAQKAITTHNSGVKKLDEKFNLNRKPVAYRYGFNDSLNNEQHRQYVNLKSYENGYLTAEAYTVDGKVTKKTVNEGKSWFKDFKKMGPATGPAVEQIKWQAHINTL